MRDEVAAFGLERGSKVLAQGAAIIAGVGLADWLANDGGAARASVWGAWAASYLVAAAAARRASPARARAIGAATSAVAVGAVLLLCALGDGASSTLFLLLPMVPLLSALAVPGEPHFPSLQGVAVVVGGAVLLRADGRGWGEVGVWAGAAGAATAYALHLAWRARQRQQELLRALAERAEALERLAEAERRRGEVERWAAAGHLADRVAHDVNSPLASLRANLKFVREELPGGDAELLRAVADGEEAIEEIREAVSSLKVRTLPPPARRPS